MSTAQYTADEILWQLDEFAKHWGVPIFDGGQAYPAECRLSCYRDDQYWAIAMEELVFGPNGRGHGGILTNVLSFGNCLRVKVGGRNYHQFRFTFDGPEGPTFAFADPPDDVHSPWEYLHPNARTIRIRDQVVPIEIDPKAYEEMGIRLLDPPRIKGHELLRGLPLKYRRMLLCTDGERGKKFLKSKLAPLFMQLDEWYHPKLQESEVRRGDAEWPHQSESFQLLAKAMVAGDPSLYKPTLPPNTHWSNWPRAGMYERPVGTVGN
jgi:hypothetical protein